MPKLHDLKDDDFQSLTPEAVAALAQQLLQRLRRQDSEIRFNDARIEKMTFELARLVLLQRKLPFRLFSRPVGSGQVAPVAGGRFRDAQ